MSLSLVFGGKIRFTAHDANSVKLIMRKVSIFVLSDAELKTEPVFECDFEKSTCGLTNDVDHEARWERRYISLGGRSSKYKKLLRFF